MAIVMVLLILIGAVILFASELVPIELGALAVLGALLLTGLVSPREGASGFGNPATLTVASMFVLSAALDRTGAVSAVGRLLVIVGRNQAALLAAVMLFIGFLSPFMNNTAAVAMFLPLVLAAAAKRKITSSRLLIPLSYASQLGGVCTLIGTSTNLLVNGIAEQAGVATFSMFEFGRLGVILFAAGFVFMLLLGPFLLPAHRRHGLSKVYRLGEYITELRVTGNSRMIGRSVGGADLDEKNDVAVLELLRGERKIWSPRAEPLRAGDILLVRGRVKDLMELHSKTDFEIAPVHQLRDEVLGSRDLTLVEAVVAPHSRWAGRTLGSLHLQRHLDTAILAVQRHGQIIRKKLSTLRLRFGDALLLIMRRTDVSALREDGGAIVLSELNPPELRRRRAPMALAIMAIVVLATALGLLPILASALLGCVAMVLTGCLRIEEAYEAVDWRVVVLLGGLLPLGIALENSGATALLSDGAVHAAGWVGPLGLLAGLYLVTSVLTECVSNNAAAVLIAPVAIAVAQAIDVDVKPFLIAVTFAASTSFITPVGYQTNTMVYGAGGYRFKDFRRLGIPLNLLCFGLSVYLIPRIWPF